LIFASLVDATLTSFSSPLLSSWQVLSWLRSSLIDSPYIEIQRFEKIAV